MLGCCAHAASGQAAAPPSSVMHSRRLMSSIRLTPRLRGAPPRDENRQAARAVGLPQT